MDYPRMAKAMAPLEKRMRRADRVHLKSPGTDLRFSIKGIGAKMCKGDRNIPDGEVFSCPVKNSINGQIQFNTPTLYSGTKFENVRLEFKDGRVINASSNNTKRLNEILVHHTGQPVKRIQEDTERDYIMSADQGKEYGIIDDVIRKRV